MPSLDLRLGIDVGGTHTDAVVLDRNDTVLAKAKVPTTKDVTEGIQKVIGKVTSLASIELDRIHHVMLGTTHATNAILERKRLSPVAILRIGSPSSDSIKPLFGWPEELASAVNGRCRTVRGGIEFNGAEIVPFDEKATRDFFESLPDTVSTVAVTSIFSPVSPRHELAAAKIAREILSESATISLSHEIGTMGLIQRENATILNAALVGVASDVAHALTLALNTHGISASVLFTQNDGTLMDLDFAVRFPILTIGSGPANSIRGAAFLSGLTDALVADVGGTTTDIGMLVNGFPRESALAVEIGGVATNFRMPDIISAAIGGGTRVRQSKVEGAAVRVGPDSVGYLLTQDALSFGGAVPTLTDAAAMSGRAVIGSEVPESHRATLEQALQISDQTIAEAIDRAKIGRAGVPLVVVGGGSVLIPDALPGISEIIRPNHFDVANAVGAAIAQVSGKWDEIVLLNGDRTAAIAEACNHAKERAIQAGANPEEVEVVELEEIPLAYLAEPAARICVKAVGPLGRI